MYMPLCRECHHRESKFNEQNYHGDPTIISVVLENEVAEKNGWTQDPKSFADSCKGAEELQLRQK
jgi:hypothetical protein